VGPLTVRSASLDDAAGELRRDDRLGGQVRGTNEQYVYARTFLCRSHTAPYGFPLPGAGLYECREIGPYGRFSCFFESRACSAARCSW
jgi:hypothetical protein